MSCLDYIVLTHTHIDHIFSARRLQEATGAVLAVHEAEGPGQMLMSPE